MKFTIDFDNNKIISPDGAEFAITEVEGNVLTVTTPEEGDMRTMLGYSGVFTILDDPDNNILEISGFGGPEAYMFNGSQFEWELSSASADSGDIAPPGDTGDSGDMGDGAMFNTEVLDAQEELRSSLHSFVCDKLNQIIQDKSSAEEVNFDETMLGNDGDLLRDKYTFGFEYYMSDIEAIDNTDSTLITDLAKHLLVVYPDFEAKVAQTAADRDAEDLEADNKERVYDIINQAQTLRDSQANKDGALDNDGTPAVSMVMEVIDEIKSYLGSSFTSRLVNGSFISYDDMDMWTPGAKNDGSNYTINEAAANIIRVASTKLGNLQVIADNYELKSGNASRSTLAAAISSHADSILEVVKSNYKTKIDQSINDVTKSVDTYKTSFEATFASNTLLKFSFKFGSGMNTSLLSAMSDDDLQKIADFMTANYEWWNQIVTTKEELESFESNESMAKLASIILGLKNVDGSLMTYNDIMDQLADTSSDLGDMVTAALQVRLDQLVNIVGPFIGDDNKKGFVEQMMTIATSITAAVVGEPGASEDGSVDMTNSTGMIRVFVEVGDLLNGIDLAFGHITGTSREKRFSRMLVQIVDGMIMDTVYSL